MTTPNNNKMTDKVIAGLERDRKAAANNTAAIVQRVGAMPDPASLNSIRLAVLVDTLFGEFEMDEDGGYVAGSIERMTYETAVAREIQSVMEQIRDGMKERAGRAGLLVPGDAQSSGGIVLPPTPGATR